MAQIHPNGWNILLGIFILFGLEKYSAYLGIQELTALIQVVDCQSEAEWYYIKANNQVKLVEEIPSKLRDWNKKFIFVRGDWRSSTGQTYWKARLDIPTDFR